MKIKVETVIRDTGTFKVIGASEDHLVSSSYVSKENDILTIIINTDKSTILSHTSSSLSNKKWSRGFCFNENEDCVGKETDIEFIPETDEEAELMKNSHYEQYCKGQWIFKFIPYNPESEEIATWSKDVI